MGKGCHVYSSARIWAPWNLEMADGACLGPEVDCYNLGKISIGAGTVVSQKVHLCSGTHDYRDPKFQLLLLPISIGRDVWLCTECFIGPGVSIGDRAVIGARSVCLKDMPSEMVCAGHPCQPMKKR